jgi:hypothetical protein
VVLWALLGVVLWALLGVVLWALLYKMTDSITAPTSTRNLSHGIKKEGLNIYLMPEGPHVPGFMGSLGPFEVIRYNLVVVKYTMHDGVMHIPTRSAKPNCVYKPNDLSDHFALNPLGMALLNRGKGSVCGRSTMLACAGRGHGHSPEDDASNCVRKCGKPGPGSCGCREEKIQGHSCGFRVRVSQTLLQVSNGEVSVEISGQHVAPGTVAIPPHLYDLRPDAYTLRAAANDVKKNGARPTLATDNLTAELMAAAKSAGEPLVESSRYNIDPDILQRVVKRLRREDRGVHTRKGDWWRTNLLVVEQLIQTGVVLLFEPFPGDKSILVLAPPFALEMSRGCHLATMDSKWDTVPDNFIKWACCMVSHRATKSCSQNLHPRGKSPYPSCSKSCYKNLS